jgi:hypothetical protein
MPRTRASVAAALLLAAACVPPPPPAAYPEGPLVSSLSVQTGGAEVHLVLQVTNASAEPVEVVFPTGQSHDFAVRQRGRELWRWSHGRAFTQAVRMQIVAPGETLEFHEAWTPPAGATGELEAEGTLASSSHPLRRTAAFRLP